MKFVVLYTYKGKNQGTKIIGVLMNMANLKLEFNQQNDMDEERWDSMTTNNDKSEFEQNSVPLDHCTQLTTSVMLMNSYFDFL